MRFYDTPPLDEKTIEIASAWRRAQIVPRPTLAWDRDNLADALEAIETHPRVERIRTAIASVTRLVTTQNIDVMAPELEALASALEAVKDAVALELNLAWTRRPK